MSIKKNMISVTIDNIKVKVEQGTTILNAARKIGGDVTPPAMCYYSKLKGSGGKCRTCMVEVTKFSDANPRPMPKLVVSCSTEAMDGMHVKNITSPRVLEARKGVVEFLLINHPLDCPVCDQAGECHLQDLSYEHGLSSTRYEFKRRTFKKQNLGPYIQLHMTRCILCYRCVQVADQLTDNRVHGVMQRGDKAEISTYIEKSIDNEFSGNMIDVCPVGALTDKTYRFKNRVWFLKPVNAHRECETCSGKVHLWFRGNEVYRVTGRKNMWGEVEEWICNSCRFKKKNTKDWIIEELVNINRHSVIGQGKYKNLDIPKETLETVMQGHKPQILLDIHNVSDVNKKKK